MSSTSTGAKVTHSRSGLHRNRVTEWEPGNLRRVRNWPIAGLLHRNNPASSRTLSDRCREVNPLPPIPYQSIVRPVSGGRAVASGAANATSGVSALRASIPCRKQRGVRLRHTRYSVPRHPGARPHSFAYSTPDPIPILATSRFANPSPAAPRRLCRSCAPSNTAMTITSWGGQSALPISPAIGPTVTDIARREAKAERHVRHLAPLAFVSPRIITAIMNGTASAGLTVTEQEQRSGL
jgi:hypothetical protein